MKNFIDKNRNLLIIIIIVILILLLVVLGLVFNNPKKTAGKNTYDFSDAVDEQKETEKYSNEKLFSKHCLNKICIEEATFYYIDNNGRIEYKIVNKSKKTASGYLKMEFKEYSFLVVYKDLKPSESVTSRSQYIGVEINDKSDYKLRELTEEEVKNIVK